MLPDNPDGFIDEWRELNFGDLPNAPATSKYLTSAQIGEAVRFLENPNGETSPHHRLLRAVASQAAVELEEWLDWINAQSTADEANFRLLFHDSPVFNASLKKPIKNSQSHEYVIVINLGCIPFLVGAANRLSSNDPFWLSGWSGMASGKFDRERGWNPEADPLGILTFDLDNNIYNKTIRTAVDALVQMLLHEAAHGCRAHLTLKQRLLKSVEVHRALESEADWGAGYLCVLGAPKEFFKAPGCVEELYLERQIVAALCNFVAFQSRMRKDRVAPSLYYLPYTRLRCIFQGVDQACLATTEGRVDIRQTANKILFKFGQLELDFPEIYTGWIAQSDQRSVDDLELHERQSDVLLRIIHRDTGHRSFAPLRGIIRSHLR